MTSLSDDDFNQYNAAERATMRQINLTVQFLIYIVHVVLLLFIGHMLIISFQGPANLFQWHPIFMTLSVACMIEGILVFSPQNRLLSKKILYQHRVTTHWILQACSAVFSLVAFIVIFQNKLNLSKSHFITWHGKLGLATYIAAILTILGGLCTYYNTKLKHLIQASLIKILHSFAGIITFALLILSVILSFQKNWFTERTSEFWSVFYTVLALYVLLVTIIKPLESNLDRMKHI